MIACQSGQHVMGSIRQRCKCFLTGDGKAMLASNHLPGRACWLCPMDRATLNLLPNLIAQHRVEPVGILGTYLQRAIDPERRVGDYVHATHRIVNGVVKCLIGTAGGFPGWAGAVKDVIIQARQDVAKVPIAERIAPRPTKADSLDMTASQVFLRDTRFHQRLVSIAREYANQSAWPCLVQVGARRMGAWVALQCLFHDLGEMFRVWSAKHWLSDEEVTKYAKYCRRFGEVWVGFGWKPTTWVHWAVAHSTFLVDRWRSIYVFCSIPTERRHCGFKMDIRHCFQGWKLTKPYIQKWGLAHSINLDALSQGLRLLEAGGRFSRKRKRVYV
jgi:hypothetical protein